MKGDENIEKAKSQHKLLELDEDAMKLLPESREGIQLWKLRKEIKPEPISNESVQKKAHFHSNIRICPWHGEVTVLDRNCPAKSLISVEGLSCGHTLLINRISGGRKHGSSGMFSKNFIHRGWLFIYKWLCY